MEVTTGPTGGSAVACTACEPVMVHCVRSRAEPGSFGRHQASCWSYRFMKMIYDISVQCTVTVCSCMVFG